MDKKFERYETGHISVYTAQTECGHAIYKTVLKFSHGETIEFVGNEHFDNEEQAANAGRKMGEDVIDQLYHYGPRSILPKVNLNHPDFQ